MRKFKNIIIVSAIILLTACSNRTITDQTEVPHSAEKSITKPIEATPQVVATAVEEQEDLLLNLSRNAKLFAVNHPIQVDYEKYLIELAKAQREGGSIHDGNYTEIWEDELLRYVEKNKSKIYEVSENLADKYEKSLVEWYDSVEMQTSNYQEILNFIHGNGTIRHRKAGRFTTDIYRQKALEQIMLYHSLMDGDTTIFPEQGDEWDDLRRSLSVNANVLAVNHSLEIAFVEEIDGVNKDNLELLIQIYNSYTEQWRAELDSFSAKIYNHMASEDGERVAEEYENTMACWYEATTPRIENMQEISLEFQAKYAQYRMELYRGKALEQIMLFGDFAEGRSWLYNEFGWCYEAKDLPPFQ